MEPTLTLIMMVWLLWFNYNFMDGTKSITTLWVHFSVFEHKSFCQRSQLLLLSESVWRWIRCDYIRCPAGHSRAFSQSVKLAGIISEICANGSYRREVGERTVAFQHVRDNNMIEIHLVLFLLIWEFSNHAGFPRRTWRSDAVIVNIGVMMLQVWLCRISSFLLAEMERGADLIMLVN